MVRGMFMPVSPFNSAQGKPAAGNQPADNLSQKPPIPPAEKRLIDFIKVPAEQLFSGISQILFLASVVVIVGIYIFFLGLPGLLKSVPGGSQSDKVGPLVPPINVADVNYPSDFQRDIFLKNFQDAAKTGDYSARYKLLENDYIRLLGFYSGDHDPKTRKVLEQYVQYMISNYPERAQESIYTVPCFDSGCGTAKYPDEVKKIKGEIDASTAFDKSVKESIDKDFEAAALSSNKNFQWSTYVNVLSAVKSVYDKNKDETILATYKELVAFIDKTYPEFKVPQILRMAQ